jgi:hypothetical protein
MLRPRPSPRRAADAGRDDLRVVDGIVQVADRGTWADPDFRPGWRLGARLNRHRGRRHGAGLVPGLLGALALIGLLACSAPGGSAPPSSWPVAPEPLPDATSAGADAGLTCGGPIFPVSGLSAQAGAEKASGPEFDALRATLVATANEFPGSSGWSWRLAFKDATDAVFLAQTDAFDPNGWVAVELTPGPNGWQPGSIGQCNLRVVLLDGYGPASWALNPAFPAPTADTTTLEILVWEDACSSAAATTGRMSAPVIEYGASTVTITLGVRPLQGVQTCPLGRGTPASLRLSQPLGIRTLLDGGTFPPAAPSPPFG